MKKPKQQNKIPATAKQLAMFGHIAVALREWMERENVSVKELNTRLGVNATNTGVYNFLNAKHAPGMGLRARLASVTGIPESDLLPRSHGQSLAVATVKPPLVATPVKARDVLSFVVDGNGMATINLHAMLPLETAMPLLRMILDAGVVFTKGE